MKVKIGTIWYSPITNTIYLVAGKLPHKIFNQIDWELASGGCWRVTGLTSTIKRFEYIGEL